MNNSRYIKYRLGNHSQRGQMIVVVAIAMVALISLVGLATDAAMFYLTKENLTKAVDAACLAAANKLPDQAAASNAAYEFMRLHGYNFDPLSNPLTITYPTYSPPRKSIAISASVVGDFYFMRFLGWKNASVSASGEGESAPLDVYLVLDTSSSMTSDTPQPGNWFTAYPYYNPKACGNTYPKTASGATNAWNDISCRRKYCNMLHVCNPFDTGIKPAAKSFVDKLSSTYDQIGLVTFNKYGQTEIVLTSDFNSVKAAIDNMTTYTGTDLNTNIGDGIQLAHTHIASEGRPDSIWSVVFMTDGAANCTGSYPSYTCPGYGSTAENYALGKAKNVWTLSETSIYTIGYGVSEITKYPSAVQLLKDMADWTDNGKYDNGSDNYFYAPDAAALTQAFSDIASRIYTRLIR